MKKRSMQARRKKEERKSKRDREAAILRETYRRLFRAYGPQRWWPGESAFEVMVGAILTQNTNWRNVEKAIANLKANRLLDTRRLAAVEAGELARLLRPAGYFNVKADRLKNFVAFLDARYRGTPERMAGTGTARLREELLAVKGIGPETADSILLYAAGRPVFVVDAYTKRILGRHRLLDGNEDYDEVQRFFEERLEPDVRLFNEFHALLVKVGKERCRRAPACTGCPLQGLT